MSLQAYLSGQKGSLSKRLSPVQDALAYVAPEDKTVPFGAWGPDLPHLGEWLQTANNCLPDRESYRPFPKLSASYAALNSRVLGSVIGRDSSSNFYNYAGTATKLYQAAIAGNTDKSGTTYSTASNDVWRFALYGSTILATNYTDPVQGLAVGGAGNFADYFTSTLKPKASDIATLREFVFLCNTADGTDGAVPHRTWWSAYRDGTDFDPAQSTQCDYEDRQSGGACQRIIGGRSFGLLFQQRAVVRITYAGLPAIFQFDELEGGMGTDASNSVIGYSQLAFYHSESGWRMTDGTQSYPIGYGIDRTFNDNFDPNDNYLMSAAIDPVNKLVAWHVPGKIYFYNWIARRWSDADVDLDILANPTSEAYTLEDLDAVFLDTDADTTLDANEALGQTTISVADETLFDAGDTVRIELNSGDYDQTTVDATPGSGGAGTIDITDALTGAADSGNRFVRTSIDAPGLPSLDSPIWRGGGFLFGAYDSDHKLGFFTGNNMVATIETGDQEFYPGIMTRISGVRPLADGTNIKVYVASRNNQSSAVSYGDGKFVFLTSGNADLLAEARFHRFKCQLYYSSSLSNFSHIQGIRVQTSKGGTH